MSRRAAHVAVALATVAITLALGVHDPVAAATTCRRVGGGSAPATGGAHHATVVVDTGSGPVLSACVSFDGTISGVRALELARATITDLDPVYDAYVGQGRAVCRLRGVGTDPPDCLGKSVDYWQYYVNGTYARGGAGSSTVRDGDVQAWRYGHGSKPRPATQGTEAADAPPPPPPTTAAPPPTSTAPPATPAPGSGPSAGTGTGAGATPTPPPSSAPLGTAAPAAGASPTTEAASAITTATTVSTGPTTTVARQGRKAAAGSVGSPSTTRASASSVDPSVQVASASPPPTGRSAVGSLAGFVAAMAAVVGVGLVVRRRRAVP